MPDELVEALVAAVGGRDVLVDDDVRASYETDWTRRFHGRARAVVRAGGAAEVAAVLAACREHGAAVVPQGGNTGMVGGGVPRGGEVVLSLGRLRELGEVDRATGQVTVGAGRPHHGARPAVEPARPVGLVGGAHVVVDEHVARADRSDERVDQCVCH